MQNQIKIINELKEQEIKIIEQKYKKSHHKEKMIKDMERLNTMFNTIKLQANRYDPHSQDVVLCKDIPAICKVNNKDIDLVNNEMFIIDIIHVFFLKMIKFIVQMMKKNNNKCARLPECFFMLHIVYNWEYLDKG